MSGNQNSPPWPARYPAYLPYPKAIGRSRQPVPDASSVNWPQAQFAPEWLPPGSASFQPYRYPDGPMQAFPLYTLEHTGDLRPTAAPPVNNWLHINEAEALVQDTLQRLGQSKWLDDRTGHLMETINYGDCGTCGRSPSPMARLNGVFRDDEDRVLVPRVIGAGAVALVALKWLNVI